MSEAVLFTCPACAAWSQGGPPHGWGEPCPLKEAVVEAQIAALDAQRMGQLRGANAAENMSESMRRMLGDEDDA